MTINDQATTFRDALNAWIELRVKGITCSVVFDLVHLWRQCQQASDRPNIYILYNGETSRGADEEIRSHVDRRFIIAVKRGRGFNPLPGIGLTDAVQNAPPFYDSLEEIREVCRTVTLDLGYTVGPADFNSIEPFRVGDEVSDAYLIHMTLTTQIPQVVPA